MEENHQQLDDMGNPIQPEPAAKEEAEGDLADTKAVDDAEGSADELTIYADDEAKFFHNLKSMNKDKNNDFDAMTVATSAVDNLSVYSGVPTSYFSKKCMEFSDRLQQEK